MAGKISPDELLSELERMNDIVDGTPRLQDLHEHGEHSRQPFIREFGSWTKALQAAGLKDKSSHNISKENLIDELQRLQDELGKVPTRTEMNEHGKYSRSPYDRVFGSWNQALEAAGMGKNRADSVSKTDLIQALQSLADDLGKTPTMVEMREQGEYSERPYKDTFGSWNGALKAADLDVNKPHGVEYPTLVCEHCGDEYEVRPSKAENSRFCSKSCLASSRTGSDNAHPNAGKRATLNCEWCGMEYEVYLSNEDRSRFCSRECLGRHHRDVRSGEDSPLWNGGRVEWRGPNWDEQRQKAIERDDEECVECGFEQSKHRDAYGQELNVHHIKDFSSYDGDYKEANKLNNLVTLCQECHGLYEHLPAEEQKQKAFGPPDA